MVCYAYKNIANLNMNNNINQDGNFEMQKLIKGFIMKNDLLYDFVEYERIIVDKIC